ncbi:MAG: metallophosphoesterase [Candidatus Cloacimonetes bacterium]|nr:metallophosphoesterase [Candidatus Cloacimonadota bacterium]
MKKVVFAFIIVMIAFSSNAKNDFHFAILGDRTGGADQAAFEVVIKEINSLRPDFVINVGDFVEDGTSESDWDVPLETIEIFDCKIYFTPGNHDIRDEISAQTFKEKTGLDPYYSFDYEETHFVVLNNATIESYDAFEEAQVEWLIQDLSDINEKENIFVFMHKPFWADNIALGKEDRFHRIFLENNVDAVFTGHWHQYAHNVFDGIEYFLVGSSGGSMPEENVDLGIFYQYMMCKVEDDKLYTSLIKSGNIFPKDLMTIQEEQLAWQIPNKLINLLCQAKDDNKYAVELSISNRNDKIINEKLFIESEDNWIFEDKEILLTINPSDTLKTEFTIESRGKMFPLPSVKFTYPFGREKEYKYEAPLKIPRVVNCNYIRNIPVIDGKISLDDRSGADVINEFADIESQPSEMSDPELFFLTDNEYLYIASKTSCPADSLKTLCLDRDSKVYSDDAIGFLISGKENIICQFYVNSSGVIWDQRSDFNQGAHDLQWNGHFEVKTEISAQYWTAEIKIPLSELDMEKNQSELNFNYRQYRQYDETSAYYFPEWSFSSIKYGVIKLLKSD